MSRHVFENADLGVRVVVGWDRPLQSYFVQVSVPIGKTLGPDSPLQKFLGMGYGANLGQDVRTIEELDTLLCEAEIVLPDGLRDTLISQKGPDTHPIRPFTHFRSVFEKVC